MRISGSLPWQAHLTPAAKRTLGPKAPEAAATIVCAMAGGEQGLSLHFAQVAFEDQVFSYSSRVTGTGLLHIEIDIGAHDYIGLVISTKAASAALKSVWGKQRHRKESG